MNIYQHNQYDTLKTCLLCYPVNFEVLDKSSKYYNKIDYDLLYSQYNDFINALSENGVHLKFLDINKNASNQVFVQDIGFVINDMFFISNMKKKERKVETPYLKKFIEKNNLKYHEMKNNIEGGDVMPYGDVIFVGMSTRTDAGGAEELQDVLQANNINMEVVPIQFDNSMIHLDCVFNTLEEGSGIISPYVYDKKLIEKYIDNLYEISKADADDLGTNYIYLGDKKVLSSNKNVSRFLESKGYEVQYIEYTEIMKCEGSLACSSMFILRNK